MIRALAVRARNTNSATGNSPDDQAMNSPAIHVVAGVLSDAQGHVLVTQRPQGTHLAGNWEFPGGKVEPGETAQAALRRELHEELGIGIGAVEPLIGIPWRYDQKSIFLDVYRVFDFAGTPHGRETQALRWCHIDELDALPMPPADRPAVAALRLPPLYAITPDPDTDTGAFLAHVEQTLASGVRLLQLRAKRLPRARLRELAREVQARARSYGAQLLLNGNGDAWQDLDLDGMHLPASELLRLAERPIPHELWLAASCHDARELAHAAAIGVDFAVLGPVLPTRSHADVRSLGWEGFAELCAMAPFPVYALGGMRRINLDVAHAAGAQGIAGISAFF